MESYNKADKTLIHISHLHPLKLVASPEPKPICHACHLKCADQCFGCIKCGYFLHRNCAATKRSLDHPAHPAHTLTLRLTGSTPFYRCDACKELGNKFRLSCKECDYALCLPCAAIPHKINHGSDIHPLFLIYKNPCIPNTVCRCSLCNGNVDLDKWFYRCGTCNHGGHVRCFSPKVPEVLSLGLQKPVSVPVQPAVLAPPTPQPQPAVLAPPTPQPQAPTPGQSQGAIQFGNWGNIANILHIQAMLHDPNLPPLTSTAANVLPIIHDNSFDIFNYLLGWNGGI